MKTTRHSLLAKGILVLLSLLILVFVFTYSWYPDPLAPVSASGMSMSTSTQGDFEYAIGFSTSQTGFNYVRTDFISAEETQLELTELTPAAGYYTVYKMDSDGNYLDENDDITTDPTERVVVPYNLLFDYTPIDVTGDGATLIRPAMNYGNWSVNTTSNNYSMAQANFQYISFAFIFRAKAECTVYLDKDSFAKGLCETTPGDGSLTNSSVDNFNKSNYGNFSKDAIVGATRIAFIDFVDRSNNTATGADLILNENRNDLLSSPALLWIPRPDIYLYNGGTDTSTDGWTLNTGLRDRDADLKNLNSEGFTNSSYSTYKHYFYNIINDSKTYAEYEDAVASEIVDGQVLLNDQADLITLKYFNDSNDDGEPDDDYYYGKVRVRIWIEGYDAEARRALAGGNYSLFLSMSSK